MARMTGVDRVDRSSRTKATKNRIDKGVAGRSMMAKNNKGPGQRCGWPENGVEDFVGVVGGCVRGDAMQAEVRLGRRVESRSLCSKRRTDSEGRRMLAMALG